MIFQSKQKEKGQLDKQSENDRTVTIHNIKSGERLVGCAYLRKSGIRLRILILAIQISKLTLNPKPNPNSRHRVRFRVQR